MAFIVEPGDAAFESKLDKASREKAHEELNEVEKDRLGAVQSFRNLVLQERWLRTPTEFSFLLRFLRARKFSQLLAKETLENYWTVKTKYPEWFADLDPADKTLQEIMRTCIYYSPLKYDKWGRRIIIEQIGNLDADFMLKAFGVDNVFRAIVLIVEWINCDENVQVNGLCGFSDFTDMSIKHHLHLWNLENSKKISQYFDKALPARMKGFHMYNEPPFFDAIWAMFSPLMREKTKSRMFLHGKSMANVYGTIDMAVLPAVYLPDDYTGPNAGTAEQIVEDMIADMMKPEFRSYIIDLSKDIKFQTQLDEASLTKAKEELHEVEKDRVNAVQSFRNLILQEKWLRTPTEFSFLLRFLRARKHSQLLAKETLENYWTIKTKCPEWFANIDPAEPILQELMRTCFYYCPKKLDSQGRRIVIEQLGNLDIELVKKKYGVNNVFRTMVLICDWLNRDENVQVNGLTVFIDLTNVTMKHHLTLMNMDNGKKMMQFYQNSLPGRMKGLHMYNEPPFFDALWELFKPLMREKSRNRMCLHGKNMANVYEKLDMSVLPDEYLPDDYTGPSGGPVKEIVEEMIEDMMKPEFREYMKELSSDKYGVDLDKKKQSIPTVASFRKLNID